MPPASLPPISADDAVEAVAAAEEEEEAAERRNTKSRQGVVVSAKSAKTVIVLVERRVKHRKYKKFITVRKRYAAHDTIGCQEGDRVKIMETRPLSKTKRWRVSARLNKDGSAAEQA